MCSGSNPCVSGRAPSITFRGNLHVSIRIATRSRRNSRGEIGATRRVEMDHSLSPRPVSFVMWAIGTLRRCRVRVFVFHFDADGEALAADGGLAFEAHPRQPGEEVPAEFGDAPPLFAAIAADDPLFPVNFGLIENWRKAKRRVEFHYTNEADTASACTPRRPQAAAGSTPTSRGLACTDTQSRKLSPGKETGSGTILRRHPVSVSGSGLPRGHARRSTNRRRVCRRNPARAYKLSTRPWSRAYKLSTRP
jgi:hypothetical protein